MTQISDIGDLTVTQLDGHGTVTLPAGYVQEHVRLGYAATEPGNQSDNQIGSITLATPATTGRGLYVAMTRGQQENSVRVVTQTHDITEARDILEAIMTSDRADIPTIAQRRQLAQQDRQPVRLQPRCEIPDWFSDLRLDAAADYREARQALDDSQATRQRLVNALAVAEQRLAAAMRACAPFDDQFETAGDTVKRAEESQRRARRSFDESGLRGRRQARTELASANENLAEAHEQFAQAKEHSRGPDNVRAAARHDLQAARHELSNHDMFERWQYLPEHLEAIEERIVAFDAWRDWANGKPIDRQRLVAALTSLREHASHEPADGTQLLVDATVHWAAKQGIELQPARQPAVEPIGIELDL